MTSTETNNMPTTSSNYFYTKLHSHPCKTREELHKSFGGRIYNNDFLDSRGTDNINGSRIAKRIEADARWENKLRIKGGINYGWK